MQGDARVVQALLAEVLPKLQEIAIRELKRERYIAPLTKTELIHEGLAEQSVQGRMADSRPLSIFELPGR